MDYNEIFSDLKKYEEQLLVFIEIYFNELNKDNKDDLIFTQNNSNINWKNKIKIYLEKSKEKFEQKDHKHFNKRIERIVEKIEENKKNDSENEFIIILDIAELLYDIHYIEINGDIKKKSSNKIKHNMVKQTYKELIQMVRFIYSKYKDKKSVPLEILLRFYENQFYLIKHMKPTFKDIELNNYIEKQLKIRILMYMNQNLNSINSFELNPLKEEFIKYDEENNFDKKINNEFYIKNKTKDVTKSMFEFTPFKLSDYNFDKQTNDEEDKKDENEHKNDEDKKYHNDNSFDEDFEESISSFSNESSILNEEDDI